MVSKFIRVVLLRWFIGIEYRERGSFFFGIVCWFREGQRNGY